jgi:hypothetical protein
MALVGRPDRHRRDGRGWRAAGCVESSGAQSSGEGYTVAEKLSAIDTGGSVSEEADEFQDALDCVVGTIEGTETETKVADTWVAGWNASGSEEGALLDLAQGSCEVVS